MSDENQDSTLNDRNLNGSNDMDDATPGLIDKNNANQFLKFFLKISKILRNW